MFYIFRSSVSLHASICLMLLMVGSQCVYVFVMQNDKTVQVYRWMARVGLRFWGEMKILKKG